MCYMLQKHMCVACCKDTCVVCRDTCVISAAERVLCIIETHECYMLQKHTCVVRYNRDTRVLCTIETQSVVRNRDTPSCVLYTHMHVACCRNTRVALPGAAVLLAGHGSPLVDYLLPQQVHTGHPPHGLGPSHRRHGHQQVITGGSFPSISIFIPLSYSVLTLLGTR